MPESIETIEPMYRGKYIVMYDKAIELHLKAGRPVAPIQKLMDERNELVKLRDQDRLNAAKNGN